MNDFKKMDETELKQYDASEGYTYKYSPDMPEIKIVSREDNVFEVINFKYIKTTFVAHALYMLMCRYQKDKIKIKFYGYSYSYTSWTSNKKDSFLELSVMKDLSQIYSKLEEIDLCDIRKQIII